MSASDAGGDGPQGGHGEKMEEKSESRARNIGQEERASEAAPCVPKREEAQAGGWGYKSSYEKRGKYFIMTRDLFLLIMDTSKRKRYLATIAATILVALLSKYLDVRGTKYKGSLLNSIQDEESLFARKLLAYVLIRTGSSILIEAKLIIFTTAVNEIIKEISTGTFYFMMFIGSHVETPSVKMNRIIERGNTSIGLILTKIVTVLIPTSFSILINLREVHSIFGPRYLGVLLVMNTVYVLVTAYYTNKRISYKKKINKYDDLATRRVYESMVNIDLIKSYGNEHIETSTFIENISHLISLKFRDAVNVSVLNVFQRGLYTVITVAALLMYNKDTREGEMDFKIGTVSTLGSFINTIDMGIMTIAVIIKDISICYVDCNEYLSLRKSFINKISSEKCKSYRGMDVIKEKGAIIREMVSRSKKINLSRYDDSGTAAAQWPMACDPIREEGKEEPCSEVALEFRDVTFGYPAMQGLVFRGFSFKVARGEKVAIMGPSGCGKSTILRLILKLHKYGGDIFLNGANTRDMSTEEIIAAVGFVTQDASMFDESVFYNIKYGNPHADRGEVEGAMGAADVQKVLEGRMEGVLCNVGGMGDLLSGGEKQRISIARCLVKNAGLLIFDEATSKLDNASEERILERVLSRDGTVLLVVHSSRVARMVDRVIYLEGNAAPGN